MTLSPARASRTALLAALLGMLATLLLVPAAPAAHAAPGDPGTISGILTGAGSPIDGGDVTAYRYDADGEYWDYVDSAVTDSTGAYTIALSPGDYVLGFSAPGFVDEYFDDAATLDVGTSVTVVSGAATTVSAELDESGVISGLITGPDNAPVESAAVEVRIPDPAGGSQFAGYTETDAAGAYEVTGLRAATYIVRVEAPYGSALVGEYHHDAVSEADATPIQVAGGATTTVNEQLDVGGAVAGQVRDTSGTAVTQGGVTAYQWNDDEGYWDYVKTGYLDSSGHYSIDGLASGSYRIGFSADGFIDEYFDNADDLSDAADVDVAAGATTTVDAEMNRAASIVGVVNGPDGPVDGAEVTVYRGRPSEGDEVAYASTDETGAYLLSGLPPGTYAVKFEAAGLATEYYDNTYEPIEATAVTLGSGDTATVEASLEAPRHIVGTVTDWTGPIEGAEVSTSRLTRFENGTSHFEFYSVAQTDAAGHYSVPVAPGTYRVRFEAPDHRGEWYDDARWASRSTRVMVTDVDVTADSSLTRLGDVVGTVTSVDGPAAGVEVTLFASDDRDDHESVGQTWTNGNGAYSFHALEPGNYRLGFSGDGFVTEFSGDGTDVETAEDIAVADDSTSTVDAQLAKTQPIIGGVVTREGGAGIGDATVTVERRVVADEEISYRRVASVHTAADGTWSAAVRPGSYLVSFQADGFIDEYWDNAFRRSRATEVVVTTDRSGIDAELSAEAADFGSITGVVSNANGPMETDAWVYVHRETDVPGEYENWDFSNVDSNGAYAFHRLPPGNYKVEFGSDSYRTEYYDNASSLAAAAVIPVGVGTTSSANATLDPAASLSGTVSVPGGGAPYGWVTVWQREDTGDGEYDWWVRGQTETQTDGSWRIGVGTGTFRVEAEASDAATAWNGASTGLEAAPDIEVTDSDVTDVDFALTRGGTVSGTITKPEGSEVSVELYYLVGDRWHSLRRYDSGEEGTYDFTHVRAGTYRLGFSGQGMEERFSDGTPGGVASIDEATDVVVSDGGTTTRDATMVTGGTISGTVTGTDGGPIDEAVVNVYRQVGSEFEWDTNGYPSADGSYVVALRPGNYKVNVQATDNAQRLSRWYGGPDEAGATVLTVGQSDVSGIDVVLADAGTVTGTVTFPSRQRGWSTNVVLFDKATGNYAGSDHLNVTKRTFSIEDLVPGTYRAEFARSSGYSVAEAQFFNGKSENQGAASGQDIVVTAGGTTSGINATLAKGGTMIGTISDGAGNALLGCEVYAYTTDGSLVSRKSTLSDDDGNFRLPGLSQGNYRLQAKFGDCGLSGWYFDGAGPMSSLSSAAIPLAVSRTGTLTQNLVIGDESRVASIDEPTVVGQAKVGQTLTATDGTWNPADASLSRQWLRGDTVIPGATGLTYVVQPDDVGAQLTFRVVATKTGFEPGEASAVTAAVVVGSLVKAADPTVSGSPVVGSPLAATPGTWFPSPTGASYQWLADSEEIAGAVASSYTPTIAEVDKKLSVRVTVHKPGYADATAVSALTAAVQAPVVQITGSSAPSITGTPRVGSTLATNGGIWTPVDVTRRYQWLRSGVPIAGSQARASSYTLVAADRGKAISVRVTASRTGSSDATLVSSAKVIGYGLISCSAPRRTGSAKVKALMRVTQRCTTTGTRVSYQWLRNGKVIKRATRASYAITKLDRRKRISVRVTRTKTGYTRLVKVSAASAAVR